MDDELNKSLKEQDHSKLLDVRLSLALHAGNIGVWDWNIQTNKTVWDDKMFEIYGLEKMIPMPYDTWTKTVLPEDLPDAEASLERAISKKAIDYVEFRIIKPDGSLKYIHAAENVVCDNSGEVIRVVGVNIDITEQRELEMSLRKRNIELQKALDEIKTLQGIIPICMHCKEIRDEKGSWNRLEKYISEHTEAQFSHSICNKCFKDHYPNEAC